MKYWYLILIAASLFTGACGRLPSRYNELKLACGDLSADSLHPGAIVLQLENETPGNVSARWIKGDQSQPVAINNRGCLVIPEAQGSLKIVSGDRRRGLSQTVAELQDLNQSPTPIRLQPINDLKLKISCEKDILKDPSELGMQLVWNEDVDRSLWQIENLRLLAQKNGETNFRRVNLPIALFVKEPNLLLQALTLDDGSYTLQVEWTDITGAQFLSDSNCPFTLDQTPPLPQTLLKNTVSSGDKPLELNKGIGPDQAYYCIGPIDRKSCEDRRQFTRASEYIPAPESGAFILYSYQEDQAGNSTPLLQERFYRDRSVPEIKLEWTTAHLRAGYDWSLAPGERYTFQVQTSDDSVATGFMGQDQLDSGLECRVEVESPAGGRRAAKEAICESDECRTRPMDVWVPCGLTTSFSFLRESEPGLMSQRIVVHTRSHDLAGLVETGQLKFWMSKGAWGSWNETRFTIPSTSSRHDFVNDVDGNLLQFWVAPGPDGGTYPYLSFRLRGEEAWSMPLQLPISGEDSILQLPWSARLPMIGPSSVDAHQSLWFYNYKSEIKTPSLVEVPLPELNKGNIPTSLSVIDHPLPQALREHWIGGLISLTDKKASKPKLMLVARSLPDNDSVFLTFDGQFQIITNETVPLDQFVSLFTPLFSQNEKHIIFVRGTSLAALDPISRSIQDVSIFGDAAPILGLFQDEQGFYGYTTDHELFTLEALPGKLAYTMQIKAPAPSDLFPTAPDIDAFMQIVRQANGDFWVSTFSAAANPQLYRFRPGHDRTWQLQDPIWGWSSKARLSRMNSLGLDKLTDEVIHTSHDKVSTNDPNPYLTLRSFQTCDFVELTERGAFDSIWSTRRIERLFLDQGSDGHLWQAQILDNQQMLVSKLDATEQFESYSMDIDSFEEARHTGQHFLEKPGVFTVASKSPDTSITPYIRYEHGVGSEAFTLPRFQQNVIKDTNGNLWMLFANEIRVRPEQGPEQSTRLPSGWLVTNAGIARAGKLWIAAGLADPNGVTVSDKNPRRLFHWDLSHATLQEDTYFALPDTSVEALMERDNRQIAIVQNPSGIVVYENQGEGWQPWDESQQPRYPAWHANRNQRLSWSRSRTFLQLTPSSRELWLASTSLAGDSQLARFDGREWKVFDPRGQLLKRAISSLQIDRTGRVVVATSNQIFVYNPECGK